MKRMAKNKWGILWMAVGALCMLYFWFIYTSVRVGTGFYKVWGVVGMGFLALGIWVYTGYGLQKFPKWFKVVFSSLVLTGILSFLTVQGLILARFHETPTDTADYLVVLGAQMRQHGPSDVLRRRLDAAVEYLREHPETKVVVSGGQGSNEPVSEAYGMYTYLTEAGIEAERIFLEDQSTNTMENLQFSSQYFNIETDKIVIVTNNFHMYRALSLAKGSGYEHVEGLAADAYPGMVPNNMLREFLGVAKDFFMGNF